MVPITVATCVAVTALALAIVVVHSLKFARWAIERDDRLALTHQPLTAAVRRMKIETLTRQRKEHEDRWSFLLKSGFDRQADDQRQAIAAERAALEEGPWEDR